MVTQKLHHTKIKNTTHMVTLCDVLILLQSSWAEAPPSSELHNTHQEHDTISHLRCSFSMVRQKHVYFVYFHFHNYIAELVIMASHQTFPVNLADLTDQTKFDQTNLLYIINGKVNRKSTSGNPHHKRCYRYRVAIIFLYIHEY